MWVFRRYCTNLGLVLTLCKSLTREQDSYYRFKRDGSPSHNPPTFSSDRLHFTTVFVVFRLGFYTRL